MVGKVKDFEGNAIGGEVSKPWRVVLDGVGDNDRKARSQITRCDGLHGRLPGSEMPVGQGQADADHGSLEQRTYPRGHNLFRLEAPRGQ